MAKFKQGFYAVQNPDKYVGDIKKVYFRSSWEYKFMLYLDLNKNVLKWSSEEIVIPYFKETSGKMHRYYPDFFMEVNASTGIKKYLIEIKPTKDTEIYVPKTKTAKSQQRIVESVLTMTVNKNKWDAAKEWCLQRDIEFKVLTEKELFN